ncbi:MAG: DUF4097 domain-containing protein [Treponema sp.]|nr:DUF4097 domain-containing protein [Treponema sp.]
MKRNYILGTVWIIIALLLCLLLYSGLNNKSKTRRLEKNIERWIERSIDEGDWEDYMNEEDWEDYENETSDMSEAADIQNDFSAQGLRNINLELRSISIEVTKSEDSRIHVDFLKGAEKRCKLSCSGGKLEIIEKKQRKVHLFTSSVFGTIEIRLPAEYTGHINLESVSGSSRFNNLKLESLDIESVSGSITINNCVINSLDVEAVSGSIKADGSFEKISAEAVSGSIQVKTDTALKSKSSFECVSGSINLTMPHDSDYILDYESMSGSFTDSITGISGKKSGTSINGSGNVKISVSTVSGSIRVQ